jgi:hypothetical protein
MARKTADQSTTSASFVNVNDLSFPVEADATYSFRFVVLFNTGTSDALHLAVNGPASPAALRVGCVLPGSTTAFAFGSVSAYDTSFFNMGTAANAPRMAIVEGVLVNGPNAGTFALRFRTEVSASVTILANSSGEMPRVGKIDELPPPAQAVVCGAASEHVEAIQERLNDLDRADPLVVSGGFGPATRSKLRRWQTAQGRGADGQCDAATWNALRAR